MRKNIIIITLLLTLGLSLSYLAYKFGYQQSFTKAAQNTQKSYLEDPKKEFGELLYQIKYSLAVIGRVTKLEGNKITVQSDQESIEVKYHPSSEFITGIDPDNVDSLRQGKQQDLAVGKKVYLGASKMDNGELMTYLIFVYQ